MSDRELLEFAAKAAGIEIEWFTAKVWDGFRDGYFDATDGSGVFVAGNVEWDPLTDDGDALSLAVKLNMAISIHDNHCTACAQTGFMRTVQDMPTDAATRRAIVLAAAAIGKDLP